MGIKCFLERGFRVVIQNNESGIDRQVYDLSSQIPGLDSWQRTHNSFSACAYNPAIQCVFLLYEQTVFKMDLSSQQLRSVFTSGYYLNDVKTVDVSMKGTYVFASSIHEIIVMDAHSEQIVFRMGSHNPVISVSPDEKLIALAGEQSIHVFGLPSGELLYKKKRIQIRQCCFDDSGEYIIYSTDINEVLLWDYKPFITTSIYQAEAPIKKLAMNGNLLEITFDDGSTKLIPVPSHE